MSQQRRMFSEWVRDGIREVIGDIRMPKSSKEKRLITGVMLFSFYWFAGMSLVSTFYPVAVLAGFGCFAVSVLAWVYALVEA